MKKQNFYGGISENLVFINFYGFFDIYHRVPPVTIFRNIAEFAFSLPPPQIFCFFMLENDFQHENNHLYKKLGGAWGGTLVRSFWALPGCILKDPTLLSGFGLMECPKLNELILCQKQSILVVLTGLVPLKS